MKRKNGPLCLQRMFVGIVFVTVCAFILTEVFLNRNELPHPPAYVLQKTYMSAECEDKRLGNAMFIYASLVGIANRTKVDIVMAMNFKLLDVFQLSSALTDDVEKFLPSHAVYEEYGRRASAYDHKTAHLPPRHTILKGYFQSWRYFNDSAERVAREFRFKPHIELAAKTFLQTNVPTAWANSDYVRVGVHIRRGDIITDYFRDYGYTTADREYYQHAMDYFQKRFTNVQFIVCSDDMEWAKENVRNSQLIYSENHADFEDLAILSTCDHTIISVGSFGWWGAWLANGTTIYYSKWPKEFSKLEYHVDKRAYFPPHWIPME